MKSRTKVLALQVLAGVLVAQFNFLVTEPSKQFIALLVEIATILTYSAAIFMARKGGEKAAEARLAPKSHYMITSSLRGCYEVVIQVNGDGTHEDLGDDTHLFHGKNFNALLKRVDGVIVGQADDGRMIHVHLKSGTDDLVSNNGEEKN